MDDLKPGDQVLYVPDACHAHDKDGADDYCFHFVWTDGPKAGARVDMSRCGRLIRDQQGLLHAANGGGCGLRPEKPRYLWPAVVVEVQADGAALLDIQHPNGCGTLHYTCARDAARRAHTFHVPGE